MPSARKKLPRKHPFLLAIACGCGGPNLSDVYVPRPKHQNPGPTFSYCRRESADDFHRSSSSSSGCSTTCTCRGDEEEEGGARSSSYWHSATTSFSQGASTSNSNSNSNSDSAAPHHLPPFSSKTKGAIWGCRISRESVAVVKESKDPYLDFHHSMLQMIVEKEIYAQDDLRRLLHCFLSLNSPSNHPTIVHAFCDATSRAGWGRRDHVTRTW
ncbi:hypothetical protein ACLOJK_020785 [Asimina triloba]